MGARPSSGGPASAAPALCGNGAIVASAITPITGSTASRRWRRCRAERTRPVPRVRSISFPVLASILIGPRPSCLRPELLREVLFRQYPGAEDVQLRTHTADVGPGVVLRVVERDRRIVGGVVPVDEVEDR